MAMKDISFGKALALVVAFFLFFSWSISAFSTGNFWPLLALFIVIAMFVIPGKKSATPVLLLVILLLIGWFVFFGASDLMGQVTQKSTGMDQNDLNACLRVKAADAIKNNPGLGVSVSKSEQPCLTMTGTAFEACMAKNVFNGNVPGDVKDCEPGMLTKLGDLALATAYVGAKTAVGGACSASTFFNTHVPGVKLPTAYCPPA
jgi:energy-coupling factor transporter transmembrane protein EcfT